MTTSNKAPAPSEAVAVAAALTESAEPAAAPSTPFGTADRSVPAEDPSNRLAALPGGPPPARVGMGGRPAWAPLLFVAAFAFLLASFPARDADVWMHLASGRSLARGDLSALRAADPVEGLGTGRTWLYDLLSYGLYTLFGGAGLVAVKALLVAGLAVVVLLLSRAGPEWRTAAACTALALLATGTRLSLQPSTVSLLFFALALWFLRFRARPPANRPPPLPPPWPLLILFMFWANVDGWFVLGLGTAALVWLGQGLDNVRQKVKDKGSIGNPDFALLLLQLLGSVAALAAACLLNPHHLFAFAPPPGWSAGAGPGQATSPFRADYFATFLGLTPAGLAYFPLLGLGLFSFLLNLPRWHWQRFLPWLGLALWSALQARAIPFFAVAAGPVLAWNLHDILAARPAPRRPPRPAGRWQDVVGRAMTAVAGLALLVVAWPGLLQTPPYQPRYEPRRWAVETPPSLEMAAATVHGWHANGRLGQDMRGLHMSPETAGAFAWFCPDDKGLADRRLALAVLGEPGAPEDWPARMRAEGINHVIVYNRDHGELFSAVGKLLADPAQWPLLYEEGDLAIFGWRDPDRDAGLDPFRDMELNLNRLAFHPAEDMKAPAKPSEGVAEARPWWEALWKAAPARPIDREEATLRLFHAEALRRSAPARQSAAWAADQSAALVGAAGGWIGTTSLLDARVRLAFIPAGPPAGDYRGDALPIPERGGLVLWQDYVQQQDDAAPAVLYLAIRAARRALDVNPEDAGAYEVLGESYLRLLHDTRERVWGRRLPELTQLRRAQAGAALNTAVSLKPNFAKAHLSLGRLYLEMHYFDLALDHLRTYLKLPHDADDPEAFAGDEVDRLAKEVADREQAYTLQSANTRVVDRAFQAADKGLAGKARDMLLASDVSAFGKAGMELELELLLTTGRPKDVYEWAGPDQEAVLDDATTYHWLRARALAARGRYAETAEELAQMAPSPVLNDKTPDKGNYRAVLAAVVARRAVDEAPGVGPPYSFRWPFGRVEYGQSVRSLAESLRRQANITVIRGLLALEEGDADEAAFAFHKALDLWRDEAAAASGAGMDFEGRVIAQTCLEWLE